MSGQGPGKRRPAKRPAPGSKRVAPASVGALRERVAALERELAEAREREAASGEILRLIAGSPADLPAILDGIIVRAIRLVGAQWAVLARFDGERLHFVTQQGATDEFLDM